MNILVLHQMGYPPRWIKSVADLELALPKNNPENNYLIHNSVLPLPSFVKDIQFDGIIMNSTFLDARHDRTRFNRIKSEYSFIKDSDAVKIALAQDDYDCNELLDDWMVEWDVDHFYAVVHEHFNRLFPRYLQKKGQIRKGYTGYVTNQLLQRSEGAPPFDSRKIDVSYRATNIPTNLNKLVILKAVIAERFLGAFSDYPLKLDISVSYKDRIYGEAWFDFIMDSKFVLGSNSGSSLIIPNLDFKESIHNYKKSNPTKTYQEIREKFFPNEDESNSYTAISPRNIEAGLLGTCQIATTLGNYSDIMIPWENFIPIDEYCKNADEVYEAMHDRDLVLRLISNMKESLLSQDSLRIESFVSGLTSHITEKHHKSIDDQQFKRLVRKYQNLIYPVETFYWSQERLKTLIKQLIGYKAKNTI